LVCAHCWKSESSPADLLEKAGRTPKREANPKTIRCEYRRYECSQAEQNGEHQNRRNRNRGKPAETTDAYHSRPEFPESLFPVQDARQDESRDTRPEQHYWKHHQTGHLRNRLRIRQVRPRDTERACPGDRVR
jgi:hypothetical protein